MAPMRSDDEDEEEEFDEENEDDEDENENAPNSQGNFDEDDDGEGDADGDEDDDGDVDASEDDEGGGDDDEDDDDQDGEDDDDDDDQDQDDDDEDDDDNDGDGDGDDDEGEGDGDGDGEGEGEDVDMEGGTQATPKREATPLQAITPPHKVRRSRFVPSYNTAPSSLSVETIVAIPIPSAVHALASTACSSYLLTGAQDGYVRAYDFYGSVNGQQLLTAQQKVNVGMGESVTKSGVPKGWWANEVGGTVNGHGQANGDANGSGHDGDGQEGKLEPVYSLAVESDALWSLTGTNSGAINMYTLRHSPGTLVHSLRGHTNVVSSMALLPDELSVMSGSWDGTIRHWDLNTGQTVNTYRAHGAQVSSISLRPSAHVAPSPTPSPRAAPDADENDTPSKRNISVSVGPDFFKEDRERRGSGDDKNAPATADVNVAVTAPIIVADEDVKMEGDNEDAAETATIPDEASKAAGTDIEAVAEKTSRASSYDPLFDADGDGDGDADADGEVDAEGETLPPSEAITSANTPTKGTFGLALPGMSRPTNGNVAGNGSSKANGQGSSAPNASIADAETPQAQVAAKPAAAESIPLLSPTTYQQFSDDVMLASYMDGQVMLMDRRIPARDGTFSGVGRFAPGDKAPPWCMSACWSGDGRQILAGRRNGTLDIWDVRKSSSSRAPNLLRTLRTPVESGPISCVVAFPDGRHIATASQDNIRLWNTVEYFDPPETIRKAKSRPPFKIIAGHHGGTISSMIVDPTGRFLTSASGDRGWQGESTKVVLVHEVKS